MEAPLHGGAEGLCVVADVLPGEGQSASARGGCRSGPLVRALLVALLLPGEVAVGGTQPPLAFGGAESPQLVAALAGVLGGDCEVVLPLSIATVGVGEHLRHGQAAPRCAHPREHMVGVHALHRDASDLLW